MLSVLDIVRTIQNDSEFEPTNDFKLIFDKKKQNLDIDGNLLQIKI